MSTPPLPKSTPLPKKKKRKVKRLAFKRRSRQRRPGDAHTIPSFCESNAISESTYYSLKRRGKGPREIELGGRKLITEEAEADWRREREADPIVKRQKAAAAETSATI